MYVKLLLLLFLIKNVLSANILAVMVLPSHSHHIFNSKYLEGLAARGHTITYLGIDEYKNPPKNIRHLYIPNIYETVYSEIDFTEITDIGTYTTVRTFPLWGNMLEEALINSTKLRDYVDLIKNEKFDLVVAEFGMSAYIIGVAQFSKAPVMGFTAFGIPQRIYGLLGNPTSQAINPHILIPFGENMSLFQRLENFMIYTLGTFINYFAEKREAAIAKKLFGDETNMREILNRLNVILVNANLATDPKIPLVPGLIPIAGLHIQEPKPLPKNLQKYLDEAEDGVIYFSLGSNVPSKTVNEKMEMFTEAFKRLAPVKVLWKYDDENFPGKPDNVKVSKWLPQNDILAHPNVRLFFTHSGMLSTHEAIYHGVPIVAMPIFLDQHANADKSVRQGIGEKLRFSALTPVDIYGALKKVLDDPKYTENVKKLSAIYRDYPDKPLDRAVYWTEYVIRHKGAPHLRTAARNLYWFQNWLIDIAVIILSVILIVLLIIYKFIRLIIPKSKLIQTMSYFSYIPLKYARSNLPCSFHFWITTLLGSSCEMPCASQGFGEILNFEESVETIVGTIKKLKMSIILYFDVLKRNGAPHLRSSASDTEVHTDIIFLMYLLHVILTTVTLGIFIRFLQAPPFKQIMSHTHKGANVPAAIVLPSRSHRSFNSKYLEALSTRGHTLTYLSIEKFENLPKNIRSNISTIRFMPNIYEMLYPDFDFSAIAMLT